MARKEERQRRDLEVHKEPGRSNPEIPSDIIYYEILPRLPEKSLMCSTRVCKPWSSLICSHSFVNSRRNKKNTTNLLFRYWDGFFFSSQIDEQGKPTPVTCLSYNSACGTPPVVHQSINRLVCASSC
ncbi:unnamed protein product [Malus baccata var. baccata]